MQICAGPQFLCNLLPLLATHPGDNRKGALMKPRRFEFLLCSILTIWLIPASIKAQDFQRTYSIGAGGQVRIRNISGSIKVSGYGGSTVEVTAFKEGPDRDRIQIEENSRMDLLELGVKYLEEGRKTNASVNFVVRVPQSVDYVFDISTVSGDVRVTDVTGETKAGSVSGNVLVQNNSGIVDAHTVSGDVNGEIGQPHGAGDLKFSTISGSVYVKAPPDLDANVKMSSISGSINTDFPIQIHKPKYGPGESANGQLGSGSHSLRLSSISGNIHLKLKP